MTLRCSVFIATSLDGYIARPDGSIDWLEKANGSVPPGEDCGYAEFMSTVDAIVMGRNTLEKVLSFPEWPYVDKPVWVVSRTLPQLPAHMPATVRLLAQTPHELVAQARELGYKRLYIDGGQLIQSFLREGLITDLTITTIPVLIGQGRALFGEAGTDIALQLVSSRAYPFDFVQTVYWIQR